MLQTEIQLLKDELSTSNLLATQINVSSEPLSEVQLAEIHNQVQQYLEGSLDQIKVTSIKQVDAAFKQFKRAVQEKKKTKAQLCQKDQSATKAAMKEWETTCRTEAVEDGGAEVPGQRLPLFRSPPPKEEAFEWFKAGQGSKINAAFEENKAALLKRRSIIQRLSEKVDAFKGEIDAMQKEEELRQSRGQSLAMEPKSKPSLQLKELKARYWVKSEALHKIKTKVNFCQQILDQQWEELIAEFESWYKKSFLVPEDEIDIKTEETPGESISGYPPDAVFL